MLGDGRFLFRSDFVATELSGEEATELVDHVLVSLTEPSEPRRHRRKDSRLPAGEHP